MYVSSAKWGPKPRLQLKGSDERDLDAFREVLVVEGTRGRRNSWSKELLMAL